MNMKEHFPIKDIEYTNPDSDIIAADVAHLENPIYEDSGPDTAPVPVFVRNIGAESPFDNTDTAPIDTNELRRRLSLKALDGLSSVEQQDELNKLPDTSAAAFEQDHVQAINYRALRERLAAEQHHVNDVMHIDGIQSGRASHNVLMKEQIRGKNAKKTPFWHTPEK